MHHAKLQRGLLTSRVEVDLLAQSVRRAQTADHFAVQFPERSAVILDSRVVFECLDQDALELRVFRHVCVWEQMVHSVEIQPQVLDGAVEGRSHGNVGGRQQLRMSPVFRLVAAFNVLAGFRVVVQQSDGEVPQRSRAEVQVAAEEAW